MKFGISRQIFFLIKVPKIKFHGNPSSENRADTCGRPTDMIKVIDACNVLLERLQIHSLALGPLASSVMDVVCYLLGNSPASEFYMSTFRNTLSVPSSYAHLLAYEDGTECSVTSVYKIQTPGHYPEDNIQHTEHGESLKSRVMLCSYSSRCVAIT